MATYKKFEDLKVWQDSRQLNQVLYPELKFKEDKNSGYLINHIFKTSGSIMDNVAEGFEREGNAEFQFFLGVAKGSTGELRSQVYRAFDFKIIDESSFERLKSMTESISIQLSLFINYLKKSNIKGNRFKEPEMTYNINTPNPD